MVDAVKIKDHDNLYRDISSKALLNTDKGELTKYQKAVQAAMKQREDVEELKSRMTRMEDLLFAVLKKLEEK